MSASADAANVREGRLRSVVDAWDFLSIEGILSLGNNRKASI
jgi:hypothetical protein